jgi:GxxExxY protein
MNEVRRFPDVETKLSKEIIGAGIAVHKALGPGLLEGAYEECMAIEMARQGISYERQKLIPVVYDGVVLDLHYRADFVVENKLVLELKASESILPIHEAQLLTYLKVGQYRLGLLMNFNTVLLKDGIKRMILD